MEVRAAYAFVLGLFVALTLVPPLVRLAGPLHLMDTGGGRKVHSGSTPRIGGVAIFLGFLTPILIWLPWNDEIVSFVMAAVVLFLFGLLDDRLDLDYRLKLLGQLLAAATITVAGGVIIQRFPFVPNGMLPDQVAVPFTILVLVGVTNAVNMSDGLDGLAGGIAWLAVGLLLVLAYESGDGVIFVMLAALLGAVLGFLRYNTFPAVLFMGDAGSQLLGFSVAVFAIIITQDPSSQLSPALPLLILAMPILDMLAVMAGRIRRGTSPFRADRTHLHHRLLATGLTQHEAVSFIYSLQFLLLIAAYLLRHAPAIYSLITFGLVSFLLLAVLAVLERHRALLSTDGAAHRRPMALLGNWMRRYSVSESAPIMVLRWAIPSFLILGALAAPSVSLDLGILAASLLSTLVLVLSVKRFPVFAVERLSAYVSSAMVVYVLWDMPTNNVCPLCLPVIYTVFALSTAIWVRFSQTSFQANSLDVLVLMGALVAPSLRGLGLDEIGVLVLEIIVMFYGIEVLIQAQSRQWEPLRIGILMALAILAFKGLRSLLF